MLHQYTQRLVLIGSHVAVYSAIFLLMPNQPLVFSAILSILLIWVSCSDFENFQIPDLASLLLVTSGVIFQYIHGVTALLEHVVSAGFWGIMFYCLSRGYAALRGWEGLGLGDVKLIVGLAMWTGLMETTIVVLTAAFGAIICIVAMRVFGMKHTGALSKMGIAFGPFLCIAAWAVWLSGVEF